MNQTAEGKISFSTELYHEGIDYKLVLQRQRNAKNGWSLTIGIVKTEKLVYSIDVTAKEYEEITENLPFKSNDQLYRVVKDALIDHKKGLMYKISYSDCYPPDKARLKPIYDSDSITMLLRITICLSYTSPIHIDFPLRRDHSKVNLYKIYKEHKGILHNFHMMQIESKTQNHVIQSIQTDVNILQQDQKNQSIQLQMLQNDFILLQKENTQLTTLLEAMNVRMKALEKRLLVAEENARRGGGGSSIGNQQQQIDDGWNTPRRSTPNNDTYQLPSVDNPFSSILSDGGHTPHHVNKRTSILDKIEYTAKYDNIKSDTGLVFLEDYSIVTNTVQKWRTALVKPPQDLPENASYSITFRFDNLGAKSDVLIGVVDAGSFLEGDIPGRSKNSHALSLRDGCIYPSKHIYAHDVPFYLGEQLTIHISPTGMSFTRDTEHMGIASVFQNKVYVCVSMCEKDVRLSITKSDVSVKH